MLMQVEYIYLRKKVGYQGKEQRLRKFPPFFLLYVRAGNSVALGKQFLKSCHVVLFTLLHSCVKERETKRRVTRWHRCVYTRVHEKSNAVFYVL